MRQKKKILFTLFKRLAILFFLIFFVGVIYKYFYQRQYKDISSDKTEILEITDGDVSIEGDESDFSTEDNESDFATEDNESNSSLLNGNVVDNDKKDIKTVLEDINKINNNIFLLKQDFEIYKKSPHYDIKSLNDDIKSLNEKVKLLQRNIDVLHNNYVNLSNKIDLLPQNDSPERNDVLQQDLFFGGMCFFFYLALLLPQTCITYLYPKLKHLPFIGDMFSRAMLVSHYQAHSTSENNLVDVLCSSKNNAQSVMHRTWLDLHFFLVSRDHILSFSPLVVFNSYDKYSGFELVGNCSRLEVGCLPLRWIWRPFWHLSFIKFETKFIDVMFRYLMNIFSFSFGLGMFLVKHNRHYFDNNKLELRKNNVNNKEVESKIEQFEQININGGIDNKNATKISEVFDECKQQKLEYKKNEINVDQSFSLYNGHFLETSLIDFSKNKNNKPDFQCDCLLHIGVNIHFLSFMLSFFLNFKLKKVIANLLDKKTTNTDNANMKSNFSLQEYIMGNIMCFSINLSKIFF